MEKTLIVFYSKSGNSKVAVSIIGQYIKCDVCEITMIEEYPRKSEEFVKIVREHLRNKTGPAINPLKIKLEEYKNLFVVTPNWGNTMAPPLRTFFNTNNIKDMNVYPIMSHGGNGVGHYVEDLEEVTENCIVSSPYVYEMKNLDETEFVNWIKQSKK